MLIVVAKLLLVPSLAQFLPPADSLERDRVVGTLGARVDAQLTSFAAYGFSGTVLVVRDRKVVLVKGYGFADVDRGVRNTAATRFEMNSMTKMFTGAAVLQLAAQGRLHLSDPVARYFGGLPRAKQAATIEQLATHTSGLIVKGTELAGDSRAFVRDVARTPNESPAGQRYRYTNAGFSLLAAIIETVSGEPYKSICADTSSHPRVCTPRFFGMRCRWAIPALPTATSAPRKDPSRDHLTSTGGGRSEPEECSVQQGTCTAG